MHLNENVWSGYCSDLFHCCFGFGFCPCMVQHVQSGWNVGSDAIVYKHKGVFYSVVSTTDLLGL